MTLPDESRDQNWKGQEILNWLVHPLQYGNRGCGVFKGGIQN